VYKYFYYYYYYYYYYYLNVVRRLPPQSPGGRESVYFSFVWFVYVPMCFPRPYTIYISYSMSRYSLFVLKVPFNTNKSIKSILYLTLTITLAHSFDSY